MDRPETLNPKYIETIRMLKEKYPTERKGLTCWRDSPALVELINFIKSNFGHGLQLWLNTDGQPFIQFGDHGADVDRCEICEQAAELFDLAAEDINKLLDMRLLSIQVQEEAAGPS